MIHIRFDRDKVEYDDLGCYQRRNQSTLALFKQAWSAMPKSELPSVMKEFHVCTADGPCPHPTLPSFPISGRKAELSKCFPCYIFDCWKESHIEDYSDMIQQIRTAAEQDPIYNKAFWIGANTHHTRVELIRKGMAHPDRIDARMMVWAPNKEFISLPDHTKYKYLIEMQGGGYSGRLKLLLHAKRLLFIQDRPYWDWVAIDLQPWVHYVPVKQDLSDLVEMIKWADEHPEEVKLIVERCDEYAVRYSTRERAIEQIQDIIRSVSSSE